MSESAGSSPALPAGLRSPNGSLRRRRASTASHATQTPGLDDLDIGYSAMADPGGGAISRRSSASSSSLRGGGDRGGGDFAGVFALDYAMAQAGLYGGAGASNFANRGRVGNLFCVEITKDGANGGGQTYREYTRPQLLERLNRGSAIASAAAAAAAAAAATTSAAPWALTTGIGGFAAQPANAFGAPSPYPSNPQQQHFPHHHQQQLQQMHGRPSIAGGSGVPLAQALQAQGLMPSLGRGGHSVPPQQQQQLQQQQQRQSMNMNMNSAAAAAAVMNHGHVTYRDLHVIGEQFWLLNMLV